MYVMSEVLEPKHYDLAKVYSRSIIVNYIIF